MENKTSRCGYIAILGRPNVGKSTLLNKILGQKVSITSSKPQTTRHQILGIKTKDNIQAVYVDTPGIHQTVKRTMERMMNRAATSMINDVDVIIFMIDARKWTDEDEMVLKKLETVEAPVILVLNKIDLIKDKQKLLPKIKKLSEKLNFAHVVPISVLKDINVDELEKIIDKLLPENKHFFSDEKITDKDDRFTISEIIREKIMRYTGDEVPHDVAVTIESMKKENNLLRIDSVIWVEREGQRKIVIGSKGEKLKEIGTQARLELEEKFNCKIFMTLWVKVKTGWTDSKSLLSQTGM